MPTIVQTVSGKVTGLWGKAMIRGADGKMRPLNIGDYVVKGDVILTTQDGIVQLTPEVAPLRVAQEELEFEAPGAGLSGSSLGEGLRVGRVIEETSANSFTRTQFFDVDRIALEARDLRFPPSAEPARLSVDEDSILPVRLAGSDPDGTIVRVTVVQVPTGGVLSTANGTPIADNTSLTPEEAAGLIFVPAPNFNGNPGDIVFTVTDNQGNVSPPAAVTIAVNRVNDAPEPGKVPEGPDDVPIEDPSDNHIPGSPNYSYSTPEDTPVPGRVRAADVDGDRLTYTRESDPSNGTVIVNTDGTWTYTPNPDYNGPDSFVVKVDDGNGGTATSTVFITVTPVNDPPESADAARTITEGSPYVFEANDFSFRDVDAGNTLAGVRIDSLPARGTLELNGQPVAAGTVVPITQIASGQLSFVPRPDESGSPYGSFTFSVQDSGGAFDRTPNTFTLGVSPLSNTPVVVDDRISTPEDSPVTIDVLANDSDADPEDTLTITAVNDQPITVGGTPVPVTNAAGTPIGSVTLTPDNQLVFTPVPNYSGPATFSYTVTDGLTPVSGNVSVAVTPGNDPPQANPDITNTPEGQPVTIPVRANDSDPDGDPLTITQVGGQPIAVGTPVTLTDPATGAPVGTVSLTPGGELVFTPATGVNGPISFPYTVTDPAGTPSTATVSVNVGAVNDTPVATPDSGSTNEDTILVVGAASGVVSGVPGRTPSGADTDPDGDTLTVNTVSFGPTAGTVGAPLAGDWGSLVLRPDGSYIYTPAAAAQALRAGDTRSDVFTYSVTDAGGLTATTTLTITVTGVNDGPVAVSDTADTPEDTPVTVAVLTNDSDPEGDRLTITAVDGKPITDGSTVALTDPIAGTPIGTVTLTPAGTLVFNPAPGFNGPVEFPYTVTDGSISDTATVAIVVDSRNDPPIANPDVVSGPQNTLATFDPRANDADPEKDPLNITQINGLPISEGSPVTLPEGVVSLNPDGTLSFLPNPGFNGPLTFNYTVSDGDLSDTSTVTVNIIGGPPEGSDVVESTPEDVPYTLTVANFGFNDPDARDALAAVRIESLPARGTLTLNDQPVTAGTLVTAAQIAAGALQFVPAPDENGSPYGSFTFSVQDSSGAFDPTPNTFVLNVTPVSDSPAAGNDTATTPEDRSILIDVLANDSDADVGDVLRITQVAGLNITEGGAPVAVPNGSVQLVVEGGRQQLLFTPAPNYNGPVNFSYTVSDGLTPVTAQVAVTVTPFNDPPDAVNDSVNTPEGRPITIDVLANDTDVDPTDTLTITSVNGTPISVGGPGVAVPNGTVTLINDPTDGGKPKLVFTPNPGVQGPVTGSFTYGISDGQGGTDTATVNVTVGGINDAPVANPDTGTTNEDTALVRTPAQGVVLGAPGADTDVDGDTLTVSAVNGAPTSVGQPVVGQWGTLTLNRDGSYRYEPNARAQGLDDGESELDQFSYTVTDGSLTSTTTLTITITGVNDGPVALDDSATTPEGRPVPIRVLANDTDADGDNLTVTQVNGQPLTTLVNGQPVPVPVELFDTAPIPNKIGEVLLDPATGILTFTPVPLYNGPVDFTYTVSDGTTTDTANVRVVVDNVNDPPDARNDVIQVTEDTVTAFDPRANDIDVDGDPLTITAIITPQGTFPISVGSPPIQLANGTLTMIEVRDANGNLVNQLSFTPNPNFNGTQTFDYTISDGRGGTDTATVTLNVNAVNDVPAGTDAVESTPEDRPYTVTVANFGFTDPDASDTLAAVRIESLPARGTLTLNDQPVTAGTLVTAAQIAAGALQFVPAPDENGSPYGSFTFSVQDTAGAFDPTPNTFTLNVTPVSDSPAAGNDTATTPEDRSILIDVLANDSDADVGDVLRITQVAGLNITEGGAPVAVPNGSVQLVVEGGRQQLLFTPAPNYNGPVNFSYTVSDGLTPVTAQVAVTVTPFNDPPDAVNDSVNTPEGRPITIDVLANDTDVDPTDTLTITSVNGTPISVGGPGVAVPNGTVTLINDPTDGGKPKLVFTPNPGVQGPVTGSFTYGISDGQGGTDTATVNVTVGGINDAPVANPDTGTTNEDTALVRTPAQGVVLGAPGADTDVDGDTLTVSAVNGAPTSVGQPVVGQWGTLTLNRDGSYRYEPNARAQGLDDGESELDQFSYTVTDGSLTSTTTLTITITGVNDGPVALDDSATTPEGRPVPIRVLANDTDADGDNLTVTQVNGQPLTTLVNGQPVPVPVELFDTAPIPNKIGEVLLDPATGILTFTPVPLYNGPVDFTYTVSDGTTTDTANVRVVVDNVNDPPDARNDVIQVTEDTVTAFDPRANDIDVDGDPLTITAIITPQGTFPISVGSPPIQLANGTLTMIEVRDANGNLVNQLSFTPNPNFNGTQTFDYTISDGRGGTDTATVTLNVNAVNDVPAGTDAVESTPEDRPYTVTVANFGFTDPDASDTLAAVRIESLPARGTLTLNDQPVTAGTLVTAAQIAAGALQFVPAPDENGSPYGSFTFSVQDTAGAFDPTPNTFTLNVTPVSDSPAAGNDTATTPEDRSILIDVLANDSDADVGDVLRITQVAGLNITEGGAPVAVPNGSVQLVVEGGRQQLLFTPAPNYNGPVNFSYTVSDGLTPVTAQVAVTVTPFNDPPDAVNDSVNTPEGRPITIDVLANDTDVDPTDTLTITSVNGTPISVGGPGVAVPNGTVTLINDPTDGGKPKLVFTPNPGVQGPVTGSFTYGISDGQGGTDTATVNVTVGGINDAPVANPDTGTTNEDTALVRTPAQGVVLGAPGADTDVDGDTLTVSAVNGAPTSVGQPVVGQWGTLTLNRDGSYRYEPNARAQGLDDGESELDQFSYTVTDGSLTSTTTLTITITGVNDGPVALDDSATTPEGRPVPIRVLANDTDADGDNLTVTQVNGQPLTTLVNGQPVPVPVELFDTAPIPNKIGEVLLDPATGILTFTPVPLYNGTVDFTYTVSDGTTTDTANVRVVVDDVNDPPDARNDVIQVTEDTVTAFDPRANDIDVDGDPLTITAIITPQGTFPISVGSPPIQLANGTLTMIEVRDANGNLVNQLSFTPNPNFNGTQTFDYTISDGRGGTDTATVTLNVNAVNDVPLARPDTGTTNEDTPLIVPAAAGVILGAPGADTDVDGDRLLVSAVSFNGTAGTVGTTLAGRWGDLVLAEDGSYTYRPNAAAQALLPGQSEVDVFNYTARDPGGLTASSTLSITVTGLSEGGPQIDIPPGAGGVDNTIVEAGPAVTGSFSISAPDGLVSVAIGGTILTPEQLEALGTTPVVINTGEGTLTLNGYTPATGNIGAPVGGVIRYSYAAPAQTSPTDVLDSVPVLVTDAARVTDSDTLDILITDTAPAVVADTASVTEDTALTANGNVITNDVAGADAFEVTAVTGTAVGAVGGATAGSFGSLTLNANGSYTYNLTNANPAVQALRTGETLTDVFSYTITDADGDVRTTTLTVTVNGRNEGGPTIEIPPGAGGFDNTIVEAGPAVTGSFTISAPDGLTGVTIGGVPLSPAQLAALGTTPVVINTGEGTLTLNGFTATPSTIGAPVGGVVQYSYAAPAQTSPTDVADSVAVRVVDTNGQTDDETLDIQILDTAPRAVEDTAAIGEDASPNTVTGNVISNDVPGADSFQVTSVVGAAPGAPGAATPGTYGSLTLNPNGTYTYTLDNTNPDVNALKDGETLREVFTYTLTDADGDTSPTTLTVTINGRTDGPPTINPDDGGAGGGARVLEAGLTDPAVDSESTGPRTISVTAPDGLESVTVGGVRLDATELAALATRPRVIDTGEGTLTLTGFTVGTSVGGVPTGGTLAYNYTLKAPINQPGATSSVDEIPLSVTDRGGVTGSGTLPVSIVDDAPTAAIDVATITEDATPSTVSGNVLGNDRVGADANAAPVTPQTVNGTFGTLVLNANGTYTYTLDNSRAVVQALSPTNPGREEFTYTVTDGDGDVATAILRVDINGVDDPTVISQGDGSGQRNVSEEGLPQGLADATGVVDTTDATVVNGTMSAVDPDTVITGWSLLAPTNSITSNGVAVIWTPSDSDRTLTGRAGGVEVATLSITDAGTYTFTLKQPIDHPVVNAEDVLSLNFQANALTTGRAITGTGPLVINVEDDSPAVSPPTVVDTTASSLDSNLLFVLDTSGSMAQGSGLPGLTRLQASIDSITRLIDRYDGLGDVRVRIVTFSTNAQAQGEAWLTVDQAKSLLATLRATPPTGGTNYDEALADAITAFGSPGSIPTGQNVSYFVTDGLPTFGSGSTSELVPPGGSPGSPTPNGTGQDIDTPDVGIQPAEALTWTSFLNANSVNSYALRVGTVTAPETPDLVLGFLAPIAWDGQVGADDPGNALIVPNFADLDGVLAGTLPPPISGNLVDGAIVGGKPGADGLFLDSITIDGTTYTYAWQTGGGRPTASGGTDRSSNWDDATQTLTIRTLLGGTYTVDFGGANFGQYTYQAPSGVNATTADVLNYVLTDFDGDRSTSSVTVKVEAGTITTALTQHNLMFTLDVSGSMNDSSGIANPAGGTFTRLEAALNSIRSVVAEYASLGDVSVRIVTFASTAAAVGASWLQLSGTPAEKAAQLNALLTGITAGGGTDYDDALTATRAAYDSAGRIPGAQTVEYFLSDGTPTEQGGITGAEITSWQDWLTARQITSYALGLGTGVGVASLNPIAFDGASGNDSNGIVVTDLNQLNRVLSSTVPPPVSGSLTANLIAGTGSASGQAFVKTVTLDGVTYTFTPNANGIGGSISPSAGANFNPVNGELTLTSAVTGAKILIDMDSGNYRYSSPERVGGEELLYQLGFADGSVTSSAALKFDVLPPVTPVVGSNALTAETLNGTDGVDRIYGNAGDDEIVGFGGNDLLFGGVGNDRLFGNEGNDRLLAGAGNDIVSGGTGNDALQGGQGNDRLTGGSDSDVFAWQFGDQGTGGAGRAVDTITDFDLAPAANGGDVLDLRDLLGGETKGAGDTVGNLLNYLDITFAGGNTEIRVSTTGGFSGGTYSAGAENQRITLEGVNLSTQLQPGSTLTEAQIIETLLRNGKLITD